MSPTSLQEHDLREALDAARRENRELARQLVEMRAENRRLRAARGTAAAPPASRRLDRLDRIHSMLSDSHSRNP